MISQQRAEGEVQSSRTPDRAGEQLSYKRRSLSSSHAPIALSWLVKLRFPAPMGMSELTSEIALRRPEDVTTWERGLRKGAGQHLPLVGTIRPARGSMTRPQGNAS